MASRAVWTGHLRLSLVSIPVEMHSATNARAKVSFRQIHAPSGKPVRYQKTVAGVGPIKSEDIVRGFELDKDQYVLLDDEEVDAVRLETRKTIDLVQFVGACEIAPLYFDKPYYLVPADDLAGQAYRVVRDALRSASRVGIGQVALRGREYLVAVRPCGDGLLLETLRYAEELRSADALFAHVDDEPVADELLEVATALIEKKTAPFDASAYTDHYTAALRELVEEKTRRRGARVVDTGDEPRRSDGGGKVIDLMEALRKSLEGSGARGDKGRRLAEAAESAKPAPSRSTKSATRSAGKSAGSATGKTGAKAASKTDTRPAAKRSSAAKKSAAGKSSTKSGAAAKKARQRSDGDSGRKAA